MTPFNTSLAKTRRTDPSDKVWSETSRSLRISSVRGLLPGRRSSH